MSRPVSAAHHSLSRTIAQRLREIVFEHEPGELLGSEDELLSQFSASRPTFRQAAKLVEQEQLLTIRRGVGGGYFGRRPRSGIVSQIASLYLRSAGCSLAHILAAVRPLYVSSARLAVANITSEQEAALRTFAELEAETLDQPQRLAEFLERELKFSLILAESSGNPLIHLFMKIVLDLAGRSTESIWAHHPDRIGQSRRGRLLLVKAIVRRDLEMAEMAAKRLTQQVAEWALQLPSGSKHLDFPPTENA